MLFQLPSFCLAHKVRKVILALQVIMDYLVLRVAKETLVIEVYKVLPELLGLLEFQVYLVAQVLRASAVVRVRRVCVVEQVTLDLMEHRDPLDPLEHKD